MSEVPENEPVTVEEISQWYLLKEELKKMRGREMVLRRRIIANFFPDPKLGTNRHTMDDGYDLKFVNSLDYAVDQAAFESLREDLREDGFAVDSLVSYVPKLEKREYNTLTAEEKAQFDAVLTIKPASPELSIEPGAKLKKQMKEQNNA